MRRRGLADLPYQARFMTALEARGLLDRAVETLPSPPALAEREARGEPLTRAEIGVLLAYAKIVLFSDIVASSVPDEPHFERDLLDYFPARMAKKYAADIGEPPAAPRDHRPRRRQRRRQSRRPGLRQPAAGPDRLQAGRCGARLHDRPRRLRLAALYAEIDALDNRIDGQVQLDLYQRSAGCIDAATVWFLKNADETPIGERIAALQEARKALEPKLADAAAGLHARQARGARPGFFKAGAPAKLADRPGAARRR